MYGLRTRPRTDVDPPRVELPSAGGEQYRLAAPGGDNLLAADWRDKASCGQQASWLTDRVDLVEHADVVAELERRAEHDDERREDEVDVQALQPSQPTRRPSFSSRITIVIVVVIVINHHVTFHPAFGSTSQTPAASVSPSGESL